MHHRQWCPQAADKRCQGKSLVRPTNIMLEQDGEMSPLNQCSSCGQALVQQIRGRLGIFNVNGSKPLPTHLHLNRWKWSASCIPTGILSWLLSLILSSVGQLQSKAARQTHLLGEALTLGTLTKALPSPSSLSSLWESSTSREEVN